MTCKLCNLGLKEVIHKLYYEEGKSRREVRKILGEKGYVVTGRMMAHHIRHTEEGGKMVQKETATVVQRESKTLGENVQKWLNLEVDVSRLSEYQKASLQRLWAKLAIEGKIADEKINQWRMAVHQAAKGDEEKDEYGD